MIEEDCIEVVGCFTYLETTISEGGNEEAGIRRLIITKKAYLNLSPFLNQEVFIATRKKAYIKLLNDPPCAMVVTMENIWEEARRCILDPVYRNGNWRTRDNQDVHCHLNQQTVDIFMKFRKLQLAGHIVRMINGRIPKRALIGNMEKKEPKGHPKKR